MTGTPLGITKRGQAITAPLSYSDFYPVTLSVANTPVNVIGPRAGEKFVITSIIISGNRTIGANGAVVTIFENSLGPTDGTIERIIYQDEVAKQTRAIVTDVNVKTNSARWINAVADDISVRVNLAGYYIRNGEFDAL